MMGQYSTAQKSLIRIGRSRASDARIADLSVSRTHAELLLTADGRYFLTDCGSRYGTAVQEQDQWLTTRQRFVELSTNVRLGDYVTNVAALIRLANVRDSQRTYWSRAALRTVPARRRAPVRLSGASAGADVRR